MDNLALYNIVRKVPDNAKKRIEAGRQAGKTDINPMWRIKTLTEQFGVCGVGWKTEIKRTWLETGANGEIAAHVEIALYIKIDGSWSDAIPGLGGSMFIAKEKNGMFTDDDAYKKAYTDAISVACKALGIAADVYYEKDSTKYDAPPEPAAPKPIQQAYDNSPKPPQSGESSIRVKQIEHLVKGTKYSIADANDYAKKKFGKATVDNLTDTQFNELYYALDLAVKKEQSNV